MQGSIPLKPASSQSQRAPLEVGFCFIQVSGGMVEVPSTKKHLERRDHGQRKLYLSILQGEIRWFSRAGNVKYDFCISSGGFKINNPFKTNLLASPR